MAAVGLDDPELRRVPARARMPATVTALGLDVLVDHLAGVHAVDVVRSHDQDVVGLLVEDQVEALVDGVGRSLEPLRPETLLGGDGGDVVVEHVGHPPRHGHVTVEAVTLVLGEDDDAPETAVDQVGQDEVDDPVAAAERHGRLGPVIGQGGEPGALAARQDDGQHPLVGPRSADSYHPTTRSIRTSPSPARLHQRRRVPCELPSCGMKVSLLTREYPPDVYGGAGVHVEYLARALRPLCDLSVECFGSPRVGRAPTGPTRR